MPSLPTTTGRVSDHTPDAYNREIEEAMRDRLRHYAEHPSGIDQRLDELDAEWDIERTLEANAATLALSGSLLATFVDRRFAILPIAVTAFLLQHAVQGWCPPLPLFRHMGFRTAQEIETERYALKMLRGDFRPGLQRGGVERVDAEEAMQAVQR